MYRLPIILSVLFILVAAKIDVQELKCLVCKATFDELDIKIKQLDPDIKMEIGGYRIDSKGNLKQKTVSQTKSEIAMSETIEDICEKMEDYLRATWKSNGTLTLLKMLMPDNSMNPHMSSVDFVQDDDLNKSLKYYCEEILELYEDNIIKYYIEEHDANIPYKVCTEAASYCKDQPPTVESENKEEL